MVLAIKLLIGCLFFDKQTGFFFSDNILYSKMFWLSTWMLSEVFSKMNCSFDCL